MYSEPCRSVKRLWFAVTGTPAPGSSLVDIRYSRLHNIIYIIYIYRVRDDIIVDDIILGGTVNVPSAPVWVVFEDIYTS